MICAGVGDGTFAGGECGQSLQELGVAGVLAVVGLGQGLFGGGEFGGELRAVGAFGSPRGDYGYGESCGDEEFSDADGEFPGHLVWLRLGETLIASICRASRLFTGVVYRRCLQTLLTGLSTGLIYSGHRQECLCYLDHR